MAESSRWWEHYYVRYFVGAAVAVPLMLVLLQNSVFASVRNSLSGTPWLTASAVGIAGLAFCYVASAPVLLLHGMRAQIPNSAAFYNFLLVLFGVVTLCGSALLIFPQLRHALQPTTFRRVPFFAIAIGQGLVLLGAPLCRGVAAVSEFYADLAQKRVLKKLRPVAGERTALEEYVDSYRHLREHGNALTILVMEVVLAIALWTAETATQLIGMILLWVLPASVAWFLGTWLERSIDKVPS